MKNVAQMLEAPDLMRSVERLVVVVQELLVPPLGQHSEDLLRILRRPIHRLRRHVGQDTWFYTG